MNFSSGSSNRPVIIWLMSGCVLIWLMVLIGGITRLTHSGLSITDWSFMGSIPPMNESMWTEKFENYRRSPEYKLVNAGMNLEEFKSIYFWEYLHRMTGRLMMWLFVGGVVWFAARKKLEKKYWRD